MVDFIGLWGLPSTEYIGHVGLGPLIVHPAYVKCLIFNISEGISPRLKLGKAFELGRIGSFSHCCKQGVVGHRRDAVPFGVSQVGNDAQAFLVVGRIGFDQWSRVAYRAREVRP